MAGRGDKRSAAAGPDTAVGLSGATSLATASRSAPGRQPATTHVQTRIVAITNLCCICNKGLSFARAGMESRNRVAVGNHLRTVTQGSSCLATLRFRMKGILKLAQAFPPWRLQPWPSVAVLLQLIQQSSGPVAAAQRCRSFEKQD